MTTTMTCEACTTAEKNPATGRYSADFFMKLHRDINYNHETGIFTRIRKSSNSVIDGRPLGSINSNGYLVFSFENKIYYAHRLAWMYVHGEQPSDSIDHINGNKVDNRIANLRVAGFVLNAQNQRVARSRSKSGLLGVHPFKNGRKWSAQIKANGRTIHIGVFDTAIEGHLAYLEEKRKLHAGCTI